MWPFPRHPEPAMAERTRQQIETEIMAARNRQLAARDRHDQTIDDANEARITTLLRQWQAVHDDELLGQVPLQ